MIKNNFKTLLKELRVARGLSQKELALAAATSPAIISKYESGKAQPRAEAATKLAEALNVESSILFDALEMPQSSFVEIEYLLIDKTKVGLFLNERDKSKPGILISEQELKRYGHSNFSELAAYKFLGNSMTPFILHGDSVIVDLSMREVIDGNIYLIYFRKLFSIKIIRNDFTAYRIESVNTREYEPEFIKKDDEDFTILGQMIWRGGFYS